MSIDSKPSLSIVIPALNESSSLPCLIDCLQSMSFINPPEIVVVDGGSSDTTATVAADLGIRLIHSARGRALQMNRGASHTHGSLIAFLHADTLPSVACLAELERISLSPGSVWGRFDVRLSGKRFAFRVIERMINWRSRVTSIATGDQLIFVSRELFESINGYSPIPLMEDLDICRRLRSVQPPICSAKTVRTSSRRWEQRGIARTILLMWRLRAAYFAGADPELLHRQYYGTKVGD